MIVRQLQECEQTERRVVSPDGKWQSVRMLLKGDEMGYSFHITTIFAGAECQFHYQNHFESVFCIEGEGEIESREDGKVYPITPGTLYNLNLHDRHTLRAFTELKLACVFNPPVTGQEVHNKEGAYELVD
ncbi:ectoine synthase [Maribrevibacterium harenarium]|uniref:L-ectoine synthase n=1 Tax=Maribrevibacterium harenarium TaxID=2589817 RepID=A0A501W690_9GAMM|nr:ectoine synthase [Maribrevibacterium harenarium]TPE43810.1 ectoine synthase [Maribrevibacterium harenarium]